MRDFLVENEMSDEDSKEAVELFILNAREIGLIQAFSVSEARTANAGAGRAPAPGPASLHPR